MNPLGRDMRNLEVYRVGWKGWITLKTSRLRISRPGGERKELLCILQGYAYPAQDPSCSIVFRLNVKLGLTDCLNSRAWGLGFRTQTLRFEVLKPKHPSPKEISTIYNSEESTPSLKYKEGLDHNILSNGEKQIGKLTGRISVDRGTVATLSTYKTRMLLDRLSRISPLHNSNVTTPRFLQRSPGSVDVNIVLKFATIM